jgi:integrase
LLASIMRSAVADEIIDRNPANIRGAGSVERATETTPATLAELDTIIDNMPARLRVMVTLAAWAALRFGELAALRRCDVDVEHGKVHVRRGVVRVPGEGPRIGEPKSRAGRRVVSIPPHVLPDVERHLAEHVEPGPDALLFPGELGGLLAPSSLYEHYYPARQAAGRPDLRFHDLRHTGATLAAATGATLANLMARLGHSTPSAALRYQHASSEADDLIAQGLSDLAGKVVPIRKTRAAGGRR